MKNHVLTKQSTVLYVCFEEFHNNYFESEEECKDYYEKSHDPFACIGLIEYFSHFCGKDDVIKLTDSNGEKYFTVCDEVSYYVYHSSENNDAVLLWHQVVGSIEWMYKAFRDKGIIFKNDIYAKTMEEEQKLIREINACFNTFREF